MLDISDKRFKIAEGIFKSFEFNDGCIPEATDGFEDIGDDHFVRAIFIKDDENPDEPTTKGYFNIRFPTGSIVPEDVWATVDGHDIGKVPSINSVKPRI